MRRLLLNSMLLAAGIMMGTAAWADQTILLPAGGVTTVSTTSSTDVAYSEEATSWKINQGSLTGGNLGKTAGPYCLVKFDASDIDGTITGAKLTFDYASAANNTSYNVYLLGAADWDVKTVTWSNIRDVLKNK